MGHTKTRTTRPSMNRFNYLRLNPRPVRNSVPLSLASIYLARSLSRSLSLWLSFLRSNHAEALQACRKLLFPAAAFFR